jgi:hypothetical protein
LENSHPPATLTLSEGWPSPLRVVFFRQWVGMGYLFLSPIWSEHRLITPLPPPTELQDPAAHSFVAQHLSRSQPTAGANKHVIFNNQRSFQSTINEVCRIASFFPIHDTPFSPTCSSQVSYSPTSLSSPFHLTFSLPAGQEQAQIWHIFRRGDGQDCQDTHKGSHQIQLLPFNSCST